jgi:4-hydroxymandelate oxidase
MSNARSKVTYFPGGKRLVHRRDLLRASTFLGAGFLAGQPFVPKTSLSQQLSRSGTARAENEPLTVKAVYAKAREALYPICRVCPQCDGVACAGEVPGFGGVGSGMSFRNNFNALQRITLNLRTLTDVATVHKKPDTSTMIFGQKISFPAIAAPIGGVRNNFERRIAEDDYLEAIIGGCIDAGSAGAFGDGQTDPPDWVKARFDVVARHNGRAIAGIKPRPNANFLKLMPLAEAAGTFMITIDMDSAGRYARNPPDAMVGPKTVAQLRELVRATKIPFVVKGIMSPEEAIKAGDAGAAGIVVSNHGGRALDHTPGTAQVLPVIADKVKGKLVVFVDGCVHYGHDVLKYLALGADAVLVGRHLVRAAFGGGREGVALFMRTMREEFESAMVLTGVPNVQEISREILGSPSRQSAGSSPP